MTKDEIKKALEFCAKDNYYFCGGCSYDDVRNCNDKLKTDALNVIIEQEREIERLKAEVKQAQIDVLKELKDSYGLYYLSAFGVKERMLADILNPMIEELKK